METLNLLVKLASLGTSGVSILAIFLIGKSILTLPNDAPTWKSALMKKYMNMCIVVAIICAVSGSVNAYFNQNKIEKAKAKAFAAERQAAAEKTKVARLSNTYDAQIKKIETEKRAISENIKSALEQDNELSPSCSSQLRSTKTKLQNLKIAPRLNTVGDSNE